MKNVFLYLVFGFLSNAVIAQYSKAKMENFVTNQSSRNWQLGDYKPTLGNSCGGDGQLLTFFKGGKLQIKVCVNNKAKFKELTWVLKPVRNESDNEWFIELNDNGFIVDDMPITSMRIDLPLAEEKKPKKEMLLRAFAGCKKCPQENITLISKN